MPLLEALQRSHGDLLIGGEEADPHAAFPVVTEAQADQVKASGAMV